MVATVDGVLYEITDPALGSGTATPFHLEWYVNTQNPNQFGLRNFRVDSPRPLCSRSPI
jgi:hypothetical protein